MAHFSGIQPLSQPVSLPCWRDCFEQAVIGLNNRPDDFLHRLGFLCALGAFFWFAFSRSSRGKKNTDDGRDRQRSACGESSRGRHESNCINAAVPRMTEVLAEPAWGMTCSKPAETAQAQTFSKPIQCSATQVSRTASTWATDSMNILLGKTVDVFQDVRRDLLSRQ